MLKSISNDVNSYNKSREKEINSIFETKKQKKMKDTYEIQKLLDKKKVDKELRKIIKFLIK